MINALGQQFLFIPNQNQLTKSGGHPLALPARLLGSVFSLWCHLHPGEIGEQVTGLAFQKGSRRDGSRDSIYWGAIFTSVCRVPRPFRSQMVLNEMHAPSMKRGPSLGSAVWLYTFWRMSCSLVFRLQPLKTACQAFGHAGSLSSGTSSGVLALWNKRKISGKHSPNAFSFWGKIPTVQDYIAVNVIKEEVK